MAGMNRRGGGGGRRGRSPEPLDNSGKECDEEDDDLPMDEDDQEVLVQDLERRIQRQQENIHSAFRILCRFAAAATVLVAAIETWTSYFLSTDSDATTGNDNSQILGCWIHVLLSCWTHLAVSSPSPSSPTPTPNLSAIGPLGRLASAPFVAPAAGVGILHLFFVLASRRIWVDDKRTGWGLGMANLLTAGVAALLKWDRHDSTNALRELEAARYKHKAL